MTATVTATAAVYEAIRFHAQPARSFDWGRCAFATIYCARTGCESQLSLARPWLDEMTVIAHALHEGWHAIPTARDTEGLVSGPGIAWCPQHSADALTEPTVEVRP